VQGNKRNACTLLIMRVSIVIRNILLGFLALCMGFTASWISLGYCARFPCVSCIQSHCLEYDSNGLIVRQWRDTRASLWPFIFCCVIPLTLTYWMFACYSSAPEPAPAALPIGRVISDADYEDEDENDMMRTTMMILIMTNPYPITCSRCSRKQSR